MHVFEGLFDTARGGSLRSSFSPPLIASCRGTTDHERQAHLPTQYAAAAPDSRLSRPHGDEERPARAQAQTREGPQAADRVDALIARTGFGPPSSSCQATRQKGSGDPEAGTSGRDNFNGNARVASCGCASYRNRPGFPSIFEGTSSPPSARLSARLRRGHTRPRPLLHVHPASKGRPAAALGPRRLSKVRRIGREKSS